MPVCLVPMRRVGALKTRGGAWTRPGTDADSQQQPRGACRQVQDHGKRAEGLDRKGLVGFEAHLAVCQLDTTEHYKNLADS